MVGVDYMTNWVQPPANVCLSPHDVHVWIARLDQPVAAIADCRAILSNDERARADRFHFERDRTAYTVARAALRSLLGKYLGIMPTSIEFQYSEHGKPYLDPAPNSASIGFNISHSHGLALLAFAVNRQVGVDVEQIRPDFGTLEIAQRFFSAAEVQALLAQPPEHQAECFFNCWTRKEAYIKAIGEGLSCPLHRFDVTLSMDQPARLLATRVPSQDASQWSMHNLDVGPGHKAAVIAEGDDWTLKCWCWN